MATGVKNILFGVCVVCTPSRMKKNLDQVRVYVVTCMSAGVS
jgi:hypothetical protein